MPKRNNALRKAIVAVPEDTKLFVARQVALMKRIRFVIESQGLTQAELAKRLGKRESEVSKWLSGDHNLTLRSLAKLEAALGESLLSVPAVPETTPKGWKKVSGGQFSAFVNVAPSSTEPDFEPASTSPDGSKQSKHAVA